MDGRSTAYQRSLRSQWRNPLAAVTLTYLFTYLFIYVAVYIFVYIRNVGRLISVARSICGRMEVES